MLTGIVRWFSPAHGYGFIQDGDGKDVFVHYSVIQVSGYKSLDEGQEVAYEIGMGPKGSHATVVIPHAALNSIASEVVSQGATAAVAA